ncbi:uncharacterized protein [Ambystoma mexicanum]|uniref:uncharacterized protein n=1 Tax=Ambystoma mexicanum TaxID=8296 RepID=UPI0037E77D3D
MSTTVSKKFKLTSGMPAINPGQLFNLEMAANKSNNRLNRKKHNLQRSMSLSSDIRLYYSQDTLSSLESGSNVCLSTSPLTLLTATQSLCSETGSESVLAETSVSDSSGPLPIISTYIKPVGVDEVENMNEIPSTLIVADVHVTPNLSSEVTDLTLVTACTLDDPQGGGESRTQADVYTQPMLEPICCTAAAQHCLHAAHEESVRAGEIDEEVMEFMNISGGLSSPLADVMYICSNTGDLIQLQPDNTMGLENQVSNSGGVVKPTENCHQTPPDNNQMSNSNYIDESPSFIAPTPRRTRFEEPHRESDFFINKNCSNRFSFPEAPALNNTLSAMNTALLALAKLYEVLDGKLNNQTREKGWQKANRVQRISQQIMWL